MDEIIKFKAPISYASQIYQRIPVGVWREANALLSADSVLQVEVVLRRTIQDMIWE